MASRAATRKPSPMRKPAPVDIDDYDVDDDPFASSGDDKPADNTQSKKRKDATGLGINEEVSVAKKPRVPNVKLDEARLLSEKGIPRLRRKAGELKFKGKGHEFSDAARLLSFYQLWLDDLFPKAKFLDALAMAEKMGHKKYMRMKRMEWIDEGKPKPSVLADDEDIFARASNQPEERDAAKFPARVAPIFQNGASERPKTPIADDLFGDDEDIYDATPRQPKVSEPVAGNSLFGNGGNTHDGGEPDEDDLDALMAEEEAQRKAPKSLFGNGAISKSRQEPDEDDLDALMAEADARLQPPSKTPNDVSKPKQAAADDDDDDDLDALMAEAEAEGQGSAKQPPLHSGPKSKGGTDTDTNAADEDEEAAMAELDGLW